MRNTKPKPFVFVLMPFSEEFEDVYKAGVQPACVDAGARCQRVDEQNFDETILQRIYEQIAGADIIVAEVTGRNANVFYEIGYAHALQKRVILLTRKAEDIPFDLTHYQHIIYGGKISELKSKLEKKIKWRIRQPKEVATDSNRGAAVFHNMLDELKEDINRDKGRKPARPESQQLVTLRSVGGIEEYYPHVISLIAGAERSVVVLCDYPAYGCVNHSKSWMEYYHALRSKKLDGCKMTLICPDSELRKKTDREEYYSDAWKNWDAFIRKRGIKSRVKAFLQALPSSCLDGNIDQQKVDEIIGKLKRVEFFRLLQKADQLMVDDCFGEDGVKEIPNPTPIDFWIVDGKAAVIAFSSYTKGSRHGFSTTDQELISGFLDIPKYYHC